MPVTNLPYDRRLNGRARELRHEMTPQERKLWYAFLRNYPIKIYKQRVIEFFIVDFYCAEAKLVIELDGSQHGEAEAIEYDSERTAFLKNYGLTVLRIPNNEIRYHFQEVCAYIDSTVQQSLSQNDF